MGAYLSFQHRQGIVYLASNRHCRLVIEALGSAEVKDVDLESV